MASCVFLASLGSLSVPPASAEEARREETVGTLDFFGLRRLTEADVRAQLPLKEGDVFRRGNERTIIAVLEQIPGVQKASLAPITVDGSGKLKVFVGIQESGANGFPHRPAPGGDQQLPEEMARIYRDFGTAIGPAVRRGNATEDHSQGHALNQDPDMRKAQDAAIASLQSRTALVQDVLKSSGSAEDRRAAAWLLGYAPDKKAIVADLIDAARDPDPGVRNNATRALGAIADLVQAHPELGIAIDPSVFLEMLGSVTWTDRNKASFLLDGMTKDRPAELLRTLRRRALPELDEIARWKSTGHAFPAVRILGRIAGWDDRDIFNAWHDGEVEKIIAAAEATGK